jgi:chemotaxis protein MotB
MPTPIIIRKKVVHAGHHGGAWKVAYADFVTAMMALFIVLWLLNSSEEVKEAVGGYFKDPTGKSKKVGNGERGSGENFAVSKDNMEQLKSELQKSVRKLNDFDQLKHQIEMTITAEGLRVELLESEVGTFFTSGSPAPSEKGKEMLIMLAQELAKLPNKISIEGHTDSKPFAVQKNYSNWELSADRANAARRLMQENGLRADQVSQVRGYADQHLRKPDQPKDASNRRISMIVQYLANDKDEDEDEKADKPAPGKEAQGKEPASKVAEGKVTEGKVAASKGPAGKEPAGKEPAGKEKKAAH